MHIAIEGNIGSGKTALTLALAESLEARCILEAFEDNPFLELFYGQPEVHAFPLELSFMAQRFLQWTHATQADLFSKHLISDYHFAKSLLFAQINLTESIFKPFESLYRQLSKQLKEPDVLIFLDYDLNTITERIRKRGRPYEQNIELNYLKSIHKAYGDWLRTRGEKVTIVLNSQEIKEKQVGEIAEILSKMIYGTGLQQGAIVI